MKRNIVLGILASAVLACGSQSYSNAPHTTAARLQARQREEVPPSPPPTIGQIPNSDVPLPELGPPTPTAPKVTARTAVVVQGRDVVDRRITARLRAEIRRDDTLSPEARSVRVVTVGRRVILEGRVSSIRERDDIDARARAMPGVLEVDDRIVIAP